MALLKKRLMALVVAPRSLNSRGDVHWRKTTPEAIAFS
jgi:hypothetical protein